MKQIRLPETNIRTGTSFIIMIAACLPPVIAGTLGLGIAALVGGCNEYTHEQTGDAGFYTNANPRVELISPTNGAATALIASFSWRIVNVRSGVTYYAELRTDKGNYPLDQWYADSFDGGTVTATEGPGVEEYYDNAWHPLASIEMSRTVSLDTTRYYRQGFTWGVKVTTSSGDYCPGASSWSTVQ